MAVGNFLRSLFFLRIAGSLPVFLENSGVNEAMHQEITLLVDADVF